MRGYLFPIIVLILDLYAFQVVRYHLQSAGPRWRWMFYGLYWFIVVLFLLWMVLDDAPLVQAINKDFKTYLRGFFLMVYVAKLFVFLPLVIDDIRRGLSWIINRFNSGDAGFDPSRSGFLMKAAAIMGSIPFMTLGYGMVRNAYRYRIYREDIAIKDLHPDLEGMTIVQISDLHSGSFAFKEPVGRSVEMINKLKPDIVFFTGDLVNSMADEMEPFIEDFSKIRSRFGVYSVRGNHDYGNYHDWNSEEARIQNQEQFEAAHARMGWQLLKNETEMVDVGRARIGVLGVENISAKRFFPKYGDLSTTYAQCEGCDLKILLSHDPSHWKMEVTQEYKDIDLTLSGHTHGFQFGIEIPGFVKWSPSQYLYEEWAGLYKKEKQYLYVNRGLGFLGYPGRVGILPEITLLTLRNVS